MDKEGKLLLHPHAAGPPHAAPYKCLFPLLKSGLAGDCFLFSMHGVSAVQQTHDGDGEGTTPLSEICGLVSRTHFPQRKQAPNRTKHPLQMYC